MLRINESQSFKETNNVHPNRYRQALHVAIPQFLLIIIAAAVAGCFAAREAIAQETTVQNGTSQDAAAFNPCASRHDHLFPPVMTHWKLQAKPMIDGLRKAEALRIKLLALDTFGQTPLERILKATAELQTSAADSLRSRRPIDQFDLVAKRIEMQFRGGESLSTTSFMAFNGRWFGRWGDSNVDHDWRPTELYATPRKTEDNLPVIHGLQYAWISNGFGWNYLVSNPNEVYPVASPGSKTEKQHYILGMVYYFEGKDFLTIRGEKAHVGFSDTPNRLIWITEQEVFMEEVFPMQDPSMTTYAITAMYHDLFAEKPTVSRLATQAVYTRDPSIRPAFYEFTW